jgi:hypothetical protein
MRIYLTIENDDGEVIYEQRAATFGYAIDELKKFEMHGCLCCHCGGKLTWEDGRFCSCKCAKAHADDTKEMEMKGN